MITEDEFSTGTYYILSGATIQAIIKLAREGVKGTDGQINIREVEGERFIEFAEVWRFNVCKNGLPAQFEIPAREIVSTSTTTT